MREANVISVSGGKDSTATLLLSIERAAPNLTAVFADTGNEHPATYDYVAYLEQATDVQITRVRADFAPQIERKRARLESGEHDWPDHLAAAALEVLVPSGNPFLDLCMWKGRFPSRMAQFCTQELKVGPINTQVTEPLLENHSRIVSWQGVRADESAARAKLETWALEFGDPDTGAGLWNYRPILNWTVDDVFEQHRRHGIKWNPLYEQGMSRVGCMPCVNCNKPELAQITKRFPEELERIAEWERIVSEASKRGCATFFAAKGETDVSLERHGIAQKVEWAKTSRGGRQYDLIQVAEEPMQCQSVYGLCE